MTIDYDKPLWPEKCPKYNRSGLQLATSFRSDEVQALVALFRALREGRDVRQMLRGEPLRNLDRKFVRMHAKAQAGEPET